MSHDAIIIGGGVAGLSAAVELAQRGARVLLLEHRPFLGGRTYSFLDATTGDVVDNGQHLLMGCYHETRRYLRLIGADHLARLQQNLQIEFLHPDRGIVSLSCPTLPAPFHALVGMLKLRSLSFKDRLLLLRVGMDLFFHSEERENEIAELSVDEWLTQLGQSELSKKYLWDIIAIGSLNDDPKTVSALLFYRVLQAAFLGTREDSALMIPRVGLSELLVDPAVRFLRAHGSNVKTSCSVEQLLIDGSSICGVRCADGETYSAHSFISAVPHYALLDLIHPSIRPSNHPLRFLLLFESSPIITIHLWLDRPVMEQEFIALLDSRVQWVFNRSRMVERQPIETREHMAVRGGQSPTTLNRQYLSLVISGAREYVEMEKEKLVEAGMSDLRRAFPEARTAHIVHSLVIKEKRATFSPKPGIEPLRPSPHTVFDNLFLAGDWTDTGLPSTIEGAVISGRKAARELLLHTD